MTDRSAVGPTREPTVGDRLKAWRLGRGLSQGAAAALVGARQAQWSEWEAGTRYPGLRYLFLLADVTGLPAEDLSREKWRAA